MSFKLFLIYHSHIDIGYTERQEVIASYQADFIKQAVENVLSEKQEYRNENEKFKFTAEGFWAVEQYLNKYGEEGKIRLIEAVKTGYFELTAGYLHFAELLDEDNIRKACSFSRDFCTANNLPVPVCAMSSDVNGMSRYFSDVFSENGVKYLLTSINPHHGGPAFNEPSVPFFWKTSGGKKILCWNGLPYHLANTLGLIPGLISLGDVPAPGMKKYIPSLKDIKSADETAHKRVADFIRSLKKRGYTYDFAPVRGSALYTDNSPVSDNHCDLIKEWNEKYSDIAEISTVTLSEFFSYLENYEDNIKTYEGEWTDWWTDGVLSTPAELNDFRYAQRTLRNIRKADPGLKITTEAERDKLEKLLILFSEHTWGHSASCTAPFNYNVKELDLRKSALASSAADYADFLLSRFTKKKISEPQCKICYNGNCADTGFYKIYTDSYGIYSIMADGEEIIKNDINIRIGQPVYQIFKGGDRASEGGFGYTKRKSLKSKIFYGKIKNIEIKKESDKFRIINYYEAEGCLEWKTVFEFYAGIKRFSMKFDFIKRTEGDAEGCYAALPLRLPDASWYIDKPGALTPCDYCLPSTCADYYSFIKGMALKNNNRAITVNSYGSPLVMFGGLNLWKYNTVPVKNAETAYLWLSNNKWETNFRVFLSGRITDEYIIECCKSEDASCVLERNDSLWI